MAFIIAAAQELASCFAFKGEYSLGSWGVGAVLCAAAGVFEALLGKKISFWDIKPAKMQGRLLSRLKWAWFSSNSPGSCFRAYIWPGGTWPVPFV